MPKVIDSSLPPGLRPEALLLLCVAGTSPAASKAARIRELLAQGIDWDTALRLAMHNRIPTLLYWHLNDATGVSDADGDSGSKDL